MHTPSLHFTNKSSKENTFYRLKFTLTLLLFIAFAFDSNPKETNKLNKCTHYFGFFRIFRLFYASCFMGFYVSCVLFDGYFFSDKGKNERKRRQFSLLIPYCVFLNKTTNEWINECTKCGDVTNLCYLFGEKAAYYWKELLAAFSRGKIVEKNLTKLDSCAKIKQKNIWNTDKKKEKKKNDLFIEHFKI